MTFIQMDYFDWVLQFRSINKPGTDHIAFDTHSDVEFLSKHSNANIWTLVDCPESNEAVILNGYWRINRLEYYVTKVPHDPADEYNVK